MQSCADIDECETSDNDCARFGPNAQCMNTDGSYECGCASGYKNNGTYCESMSQAPCESKIMHMSKFTII